MLSIEDEIMIHEPIQKIIANEEQIEYNETSKLIQWYEKNQKTLHKLKKKKRKKITDFFC